jgi:phosphatidylethanolamine/phosphatidyl-N-methylethanolamine N-methyltransferase
MLSDTRMLDTRDPDRAVMERAYALWAPVYDLVFKSLFESARRVTAQAARQVGGRVLEVGVGTGLSFDDYDSTTEVHGIDLSEPMIAKARRKLSTGRYPYVKSVEVMDAQDLRFPDNHFDCVAAQFVITLVADPERVLDECARVVKPGGEIILVNHFYSERGAAAAVERMFARKAHVVGLRPAFPFSRLAAWAFAHGGVTLLERRQLPNAHTLVRFGRLMEAPPSKAA